MDVPPVQYARTSDGYDIAYQVFGQGSPLVLMPTWWSHPDLYWREGSSLRNFVEQLATRFRVVRFDSRGQGLSKRGLDSNTSMASYEADLEAVVDRLKLDRFTLLGRAYKGHAAVTYTVNHPARVSALVLWNCRVD